MIDLFGNRWNETYTYRRVPWPDLSEGADLGDVTSGRVELSAFSDLKARCDFNFEGMEAPDPKELIRIYYSFDDDYGEHASFCIGTFFIGLSKVTNIAEYRNGECVGLRMSGTAEGWSTLKVLQDVKIGFRKTVHADTYAIREAVSIIESVGLKAEAGDSSYKLSTDYTFEPEDTLLTVVNWLCTAAGFQAPYPDPYGTLMLVESIAPTDRTVAHTFVDDDKSIMYPEVEVENDWQTTPNVCKLNYSSDEVAMHAEARNVFGSKASLDNRGDRELTMVETVSELSGSDSTEMLANLKEMAAKKLTDNSQEIERVHLSHPYIQLVANDAVKVQYADRFWSGNVQTMAISLQPSTKCDTTIRRFVPNSITVTTSGSVDWEAS